MTLNTIPDGWSFDQLQALNDLEALTTALDNATRVGQNLLRDVSPESGKVQTDLIALIQQKWETVKTFPTL